MIDFIDVRLSQDKKSIIFETDSHEEEYGLLGNLFEPIIVHLKKKTHDNVFQKIKWIIKSKTYYFDNDNLILQFSVFDEMNEMIIPLTQKTTYRFLLKKIKELKNRVSVLEKEN